MARDRSDHLITSRKQYPALQIQTPAKRQQLSDNGFFVAKVGYLNRMRRIPREARNRKFVVNDADRHTVTAQASHDAQTLVVPAHDDGPGRTIRTWFFAFRIRR